MRKVLPIFSLTAALVTLACLLHKYVRMASLMKLVLEQPSVALVPAIAIVLIAYVWLVTIRLSVARAEHVLKREVEKEKRQREIAEVGNRARGAFLAHMSHEIRTPMNGILGFTELALKSELAPELRGYLDSVRTSAKWLMHVINDILDFSSLEAGELVLVKESFSLEECIRPAMEMVQAQADEKRLALKSSLDPRIPQRLLGDRTRLAQIMINLLDNAVKFTSTGSVLVSAALESESEREVTVRISIADTGMGIPADRQPLLFEPFVRSGDSPSNPRDPGVGLAICSKLVRLMGGEMDVQSQLGAGSRFSFSVRLEKSSGSMEAERPSAALETRPLSLLVAEDNAVSRHLLTRLLESAGHSVTQASTGEEAVRHFQGGSFDAVLMDVAMPQMDGLEAVRRIRSAEASGRHVPIYATTAYTMPADRQNCLDAGMDGLISKPLDVDELLALVKAIGQGEQAAISESVHP